MMPLVVAVTICMLIIILGVAEYMRLVITAAGIKDAMESAVISTVNDNYNEVYHSVREGYAAGYEPDGESFSPSVDYGDIYSRMCFLLGLEEDGAGYVRINNGGEMEYCLSNLCVYIHNNALGAGGGAFGTIKSGKLTVSARYNYNYNDQPRNYSSGSQHVTPEAVTENSSRSHWSSRRCGFLIHQQPKITSFGR